MEYRMLGDTGIRVSLICLGTMTFGEQNTAEEGIEQMDYAFTQGINFLDTAEMYAIPPRAATFGKTEEIVGAWLKKSGKRREAVIATKVVGPAPHFTWIRGGKARLDRANMTEALEGSLRRLGTDVIDLYQLHWPARPVDSFGQRGYRESEVSGREEEEIEHSLEVLAGFVTAGKVRAVGLSNETPWGVMAFLRRHEKKNLPRVVSVQNAYNLLNRKFEAGLAEIALQEKTGLLAYSPLGGGTLTGKYLGGKVPKGSRRDHDSRPSRYVKPHAEEATAAYVGIAQKHGLDPAQMALAFVNARPFVTSNIIGATNMEQLKTNIASVNLALPEAVTAEIEAVHARHPDPCP